MSGALTLADLRRWEAHGATWRAVEIADARVVVQLCTCTGEPEELAQGDEPALIDYVRRTRAAGA